jgi:hypothetical protein
MHFQARFEAEQLADIGFRQPAASASVDSKSFESGAGDVLARSGERANQLVGYLKGNGH